MFSGSGPFKNWIDYTMTGVPAESGFRAGSWLAFFFPAHDFPSCARSQCIYYFIVWFSLKGENVPSFFEQWLGIIDVEVGRISAPPGQTTRRCQLREGVGVVTCEKKCT